MHFFFSGKQSSVTALLELCWRSCYTHPNKSSSQRNPKTPAEGRRGGGAGVSGEVIVGIGSERSPYFSSAVSFAAGAPRSHLKAEEPAFLPRRRRPSLRPLFHRRRRCRLTAAPRKATRTCPRERRELVFLHPRWW
jgi:hypothetical protein